MNEYIIKHIEWFLHQSQPLIISYHESGKERQLGNRRGHKDLLGDILILDSTLNTHYGDGKNTISVCFPFLDFTFELK